MLIWAAVREDLERLSQLEVGAEIRLEQAPHANLGGVFWLNAGFALENLLKGIIVKDKPDFVINGRITRPLQTHNLFKLAKRASIDLNVIEAFYLSVGTQCMIWAGRYPSSTKPEEKAPPGFFRKRCHCLQVPLRSTCRAIRYWRFQSCDFLTAGLIRNREPAKSGLLGLDCETSLPGSQRAKRRLRFHAELTAASSRKDGADRDFSPYTSSAKPVDLVPNLA